MDSGTVWGIVIVGYILLGIPAMSAASNGPKPKDTVPGSAKMKQWEQNEGRGQKWLVIWCAGFALIMAAWWLIS